MWGGVPLWALPSLKHGNLWAGNWGGGGAVGYSSPINHYIGGGAPAPILLTLVAFTTSGGGSSDQKTTYPHSLPRLWGGAAWPTKTKPAFGSHVGGEVI